MDGCPILVLSSSFFALLLLCPLEERLYLGCVVWRYVYVNWVWGMGMDMGMG